MKQSTKLLSMLLAVLVAFSCFSVIGSAALNKGDITYDCIDDADLTYKQVANLALDLVDNDLLAGMDTIDLSIVGELRLDSIDHILADIHSLRNGFVWAIGKGLLGDVGKLDFTGLTVDDNDKDPLQRNGGESDYEVISGLLLFISENAGTLSKAAYGLSGGDGISLGLIGSFLNLGDIGEMLNNIPGMLTELVFDLLVYGSYGYDKDIEDIKEDKSTLTATYPEMDTLNEMLPNVLYNLLTKPQDYTWEGEGEDSVKVWDMGSVLVPNLNTKYGKTKDDINPLSKSFFQILDTAAQIAINEIGIPALNNNLKKALMLAVEAELNEIDEATLQTEAPTIYTDVFEANKAEEEKSYVTYFAYDKMAKAGGVWYYTTLETEVEEDPLTGEPKLDEEGNEITYKDRKYYKVNMGPANEFASLINWDWDFVGTDVTPAAGQTQLDYQALVDANGSFIGSLNSILGIVYNTALTDAAKADYLAKAQTIDKTYIGWADENGNDDLMINVEYLTKYILTMFGDKIFGEDSQYANYKWDDVKDLTLLGIVAMIGPEFFEDAMPQIILPKHQKDDPEKNIKAGTYAFHEGVQLWEFAAIVLRELMTGIAPIVNYDSVIFANGDVTSAADRQFAEHDADEWFNIILNMGTDLGLVYLQQLTNFSDYCAEVFGPDFVLDDYISTGGTEENHWTTSLDYAILWAVRYVGGQKTTGVLNGINYNDVEAVEGPLNKLSFILNKLLPLGFVGEAYTSDEYELDLSLVVDGIKTLLTDFDLNVVLKLFGRNETSKYNLLDDASLGTAVLDLVNRILNLVFGKTILQNVKAVGSVQTQSLDDVISQAALKTTVQNLLTGLNDRKDDILKNALPVVGKLIKGWGTEQSFQNPVDNIPTHITVQENGSTFWEGTKEVDCKDVPSLESSPLNYTIRNGSDGLWRHYVDPTTGEKKKDEQYKIQLVSVNFYEYDGVTASKYVHSISFDTGVIDYGKSANLSLQVGTFTVSDNSATGGAGYSAVPADGVVQKMKIGYKVFIEDGSALLNNTTFYSEEYVWLSRYGHEERVSYAAESECYYTAVYSPTYVPYYEDDVQATLDWIKGMEFGAFQRNQKDLAGKKADFVIKVTAETDTDGLTIGSTSANCTENANLVRIPVRIFDTYSGDWKKEDNSGTAGSYSINGKVPSATDFANNVKPEEVNSAKGASSSWTVDLQAQDNDTNGIGFVLKYYNADYRDMLLDLVASENNAQRVESDYKHIVLKNNDVTVTVDSEEPLKHENSTDENGKFVLKETNFAPTNGKTVIKSKTAWDNYNTALLNALNVGLQEWNRASKFNFKETYNALRVAVNDLEYCLATAEDGAVTLGTTIDALENQLRAAQAETTDIYNYTDYKMYRINRYNDARDDANWYINLKDDASPKKVEEIDEYFDYSWMEENDFRELVGQHTIKYGDKAGETIAANQYQAYLLELLEKFDEEEIEAKKNWLNDRKKEYANLSALDLAMASNYLTLTKNRLLKRDCGVIYAQLNDEITSAQNMIGTTNGAKGITYTAGSWANYIEAYNTAVDAQDCGSQKLIFDAKYQLCVQRKNLVPVAEEGDYNELNALIGYAQFALANADLYENSDKEFGQVLAELGMDPITNTDGYDVQLFPGSALLTVDRAYGIDDQRKIDDAATALKEALARLKFKGLTVKETFGDKEVVGTETIFDAVEEEGIEAVTALVSHIAAGTTVENVPALFDVIAEKASVSKVVVTGDNNYSTSYEDVKLLEGLAGTNSTVTFYTEYTAGSDTILLPVATVKIVVDGDINGDGAVDVLDAAYGALVESKKTELEGCYLLAGDLSGGDRELTATDYQQLVAKVVA